MLIVEDDPDIRGMLAEVMSDLLLAPPDRPRVETAHDLRTAREAVRARRPDLLLLDVVLPDGDGLELCRELAVQPRGGRVPVVALSAATPTADVAERARAAGCAAFLPKPLDIDELLDLVRRLLRPADAAP